MSLGLRKLTAANSHTAVLFINQTRLNVGVMFGDPETVPGGKALPFYASYRVALRKAGKEKEAMQSYDSEGKKVNSNQVVGHKIRATLEKSKLSAPSRDVLFTFDLRSGQVDETGYLLSVGLEKGLIHHEGRSWWVDNGERVVGIDKFLGWLKENQQVTDQIKQALLGPDGDQEADKKKGVRLRRKSPKG
jgi:recombination protein RecA